MRGGASPRDGRGGRRYAGHPRRSTRFRAVRWLRICEPEPRVLRRADIVGGRAAAPPASANRGAGLRRRPRIERLPSAGSVRSRRARVRRLPCPRSVGAGARGFCVSPAPSRSERAGSGVSIALGRSERGRAGSASLLRQAGRSARASSAPPLPQVGRSGGARVLRLSCSKPVGADARGPAPALRQVSRSGGTRLLHLSCAKPVGTGARVLRLSCAKPVGAGARGPVPPLRQVGRSGRAGSASLLRQADRSGRAGSGPAPRGRPASKRRDPPGRGWPGRPRDATSAAEAGSRRVSRRPRPTPPGVSPEPPRRPRWR